MLTPHEKQERMDKLRAYLWQQDKDFEKLHNEYIELSERYDLEVAKKELEIKTLNPKATVKEIEARTLIELHDLRLKVNTLKAKIEIVKNRIKTINTDLQGLISQLSWDKAELEKG